MAAPAGNVNRLVHGGYSERVVKRAATTQKRRYLRQCGLRLQDIDGTGRVLLDSWSRAQGLVEVLDAWAAVHRPGWVDEDGTPPPFAAFYLTALNSAQRFGRQLGEHLKARTGDPSMVVRLQQSPRRVA